MSCVSVPEFGLLPGVCTELASLVVGPSQRAPLTASLWQPVLHQGCLHLQHRQTAMSRPPITMHSLHGAASSAAGAALPLAAEIGT